MKTKCLAIFLLSFLLQSTWAQTGGAFNRGQLIPSDSTSGKNNIELMQQEMMGSIVKTCQENINKDCAINETVKSIVNTACAKEKSREEKDGCFTIAESMLSSLLNNISSQERQIYQKIYNQQPHIVEKIKKQNEEEEIKKALVKKEQDEKVEENKRALIKKQQEGIEHSKLAVSETAQSTSASSQDRFQAIRDKIAGGPSTKSSNIDLSKVSSVFPNLLADLVSLIIIFGASIYLKNIFMPGKKTEEMINKIFIYLKNIIKPNNKTGEK